MKFFTSSSLLALVFIPATISAAPTSNQSTEADALVKRADFKAVTCGSGDSQQNWSADVVKSSYQALVDYSKVGVTKPKTTLGREYPQQFAKKKNMPGIADIGVKDALDAIPECRTGQAGMKYFEFPLLDPIWTGGLPGSQERDRVIAISPTPAKLGDSRTFTYCIATTHRDMIPGAVKPCTVN